MEGKALTSSHKDFFWKILFTAQTFLPSCGENTEFSIDINMIMAF